VAAFYRRLWRVQIWTSTLIQERSQDFRHCTGRTYNRDLSRMAKAGEVSLVSALAVEPDVAKAAGRLRPRAEQAVGPLERRSRFGDAQGARCASTNSRRLARYRETDFADRRSAAPDSNKS